jgi:hypothetical protein
MHIHGYPVALGLLAFAVGAGLWHRGWVHRFAACMFVLAAFLLGIGIIPWQDALAGLTGTGTGAVALLIVAIFTGLGFWYELSHKREARHHHAHILAMACGTAVVMLVGNSARLLREASRSPGKTATALAQSVRGIRSGHAAAAMSHHQSLVILGAVAGGAVVLLIAGGKHERRKPAPARAPLAITSGRPAAHAPARRPAGNAPAPRTALPPAPNRRGR